MTLMQVDGAHSNAVSCPPAGRVWKPAGAEESGERDSLVLLIIYHGTGVLEYVP